MKYNKLLILVFCSLTWICSAQEQLGLRTENYSGINSILLNPANNLTSPFQWDINLAGGGVFVDNNFGGFGNASISDLRNARAKDILLATDFPSDQQFPGSAVVFDFEEPGRKKFGLGLTSVMGPAFMLNFEQHTFGIFTNFRAIGGGHQIPAVFGYYDYRNITANQDYGVPPSNVSGMAWTELGLNYAFKAETTNGKVGIGFNIRYLQGYESFFIKNNTNLRITKLQRDSLNFQNGADIDFGFTTSSLDEEDVNLQRNGTGFGVDLGLTFATPEYQDGYGLKLGLSVLDIGKIKFDNQTEMHRIDINDAFSFDPRQLDDVTDFRDGLAQLETELFMDTTTTFSGTTYDMWLPGALSLQADVGIRENIYVNATLVQRLSMGEINVQRGNLFALTPRFESRWVSAFLPVSIYNWQHVKIGTAIRLAFFTFGTEDLGSFFGKKNLTGTDFYAGIKINPFRLGWKGGGGKGKEMKCYQF